MNFILKNRWKILFFRGNLNPASIYKTPGFEKKIEIYKKLYNKKYSEMRYQFPSSSIDVNGMRHVTHKAKYGAVMHFLQINPSGGWASGFIEKQHCLG